MSLPIAVVDAFTDRAFAGNPAAVCRLPAWPSDEWLAAVARELNLSETAFVVPREDGDHDLRWFTPAVEVDLCGHATLATAHLFGGATPLRFHTRSGVLTCTLGPDGVELDFPALAATPSDRDPSRVADALGLDLVADVWESRFDLLVTVTDAAIVRGLAADPARVRSLGARGVIVTAPGDRPGIDCVSRFFAPGAGIDEDPVTGSAHCVLAPFWAARTGRATLVGEQASPRGGIVRMRLDGDRVHLGGRAVTVWQGELLVAPDAAG